MEIQISNRIFELLLAEWAGYGDRPEAIFQNWENQEQELIAAELSAFLENHKHHSCN